MASATDIRATADIGSKEMEGRTAKAIREASSNGNDHHAQVSGFGTETAGVSAQVTNELLANATEVAGTFSKKLTEVTLDQTRKLLDDTTRAAAAYQQGTRGTGSGLQALMKSYSDFALGLNQLPTACFETMTQAVKRDGRRKPLELLQCRTTSDVAELQMSLYRDALTDAVEMSMAMFRIMGHVSETAMKPLQKTSG